MLTAGVRSKPYRAIAQQRHAARSQRSDNGSHPEIKLIFSDVDGTLLNSQQKLTKAVERAVHEAQDLGVEFAIATGKALGPWREDVLPRLRLRTPCVFMQGLLVCAADGEVLYCRNLEDDVIMDCIAFARDHGLTLTAYSSDRILCEATDQHTNRLIWYGEPVPEAVGRMERVVGSVNIQKMIFMAPQHRIDEVRDAATRAFEGRASLTTALSGMLEVLPLGASKGDGVTRVLSMLNVDAQHVMALGDGENDIEMLRLAGTAVAMGNASARVAAAALYVTASNNEDGVAAAIHRFVLAPSTARRAA